MGKTPRISSALKAIDLKQEPPPLIIGERLNTQGSKKAKEMVLMNDFDGLVNLARAQVEDGAHCLDVCVATGNFFLYFSYAFKCIFRRL